MRRYLTLLLCILIPTTCPATIVILHGSFSTNSKWYREGGQFHTQLSEQAEKEHNQIRSFAWSGGISQRDIISAAGDFANYLLSLEHTDDLSLVAHSNGGNVVSYATMILADLRRSLDEPKKAAEPLPSLALYQPFTQTIITKMNETQQVIERDLEDHINQMYSKLHHTFIRRSPSRLLTKRFAIRQLFLLGTPIDTNKFCIDMAVVQNVFNLYSVSDIVQPLVGAQHLPFHERNSNIHVSIHEHHECEDCLEEAQDLDKPIAPCHECIHHPIVGRWLLSIPKLLEQDQRSTHSLKDGELTLHAQVPPHFAPHDQAAPQADA